MAVSYEKFSVVCWLSGIVNYKFVAFTLSLKLGQCSVRHCRDPNGFGQVMSLLLAN